MVNVRQKVHSSSAEMCDMLAAVFWNFTRLSDVCYPIALKPLRKMTSHTSGTTLPERPNHEFRCFFRSYSYMIAAEREKLLFVTFCGPKIG